MPRRSAPYGPIFGIARDLPRGPHELTREEVAESQRIRLLIAMTELVAQQGYATVTLAQIAQRAGVSPRTFYSYFADKLDCFVTAYDRFKEVLSERLEVAVMGGDGLEEVIDATLIAYLGSLQSDLLAARAFLIEGPAAGTAVRQQRRATDDRLAALLHERHRQLRAHDRDLRELPTMVFPAIVHAVRELTCDLLETSSESRAACARRGPQRVPGRDALVGTRRRPALTNRPTDPRWRVGSTPPACGSRAPASRALG